MNPDMVSLFRLFSMVGVLLVSLTILNHALQMVIRENQPVLRNFAARVRGWWIMAVLMAGAGFIGPGAVVLVFAVCSMGALREFLTLTTRTKADHWAFVASFFVVLPVQYVAIWFDWYGFYAVFIPVYAFLILPMLSVLRGRVDNFLSRVAQTQWALMVSVFCMSHVAAMLYLDIPGFDGGNMFLMAFLVLVVQSSDLFQHFWSSCLGKRPIAAAISQSRTWEGFVGGVLTAGLLGAALSWLTPFGMWGGAAMAMAVSATGGMGRLVMAAIKQDRGVRDWGHMNDGQGGFIDRLDSVIFAAPVFFHLTRFFWQTLA